MAALAAEAARPPFSAAAPPSALGAVSEAFADSLGDYLEENPEKLLKDKVGVQSSGQCKHCALLCCCLLRC